MKEPLDQADEAIFTYEVSDEALEAAATGRDMGANATDGGQTYCWSECATKKYVCTTKEPDCKH
jgi:hypothetical protein